MYHLSWCISTKRCADDTTNTYQNASVSHTRHSCEPLTYLCRPPTSGRETRRGQPTHTREIEPALGNRLVVSSLLLSNSTHWIETARLLFASRTEFMRHYKQIQTNSTHSLAPDPPTHSQRSRTGSDAICYFLPTTLSNTGKSKEHLALAMDSPSDSSCHVFSLI